MAAKLYELASQFTDAELQQMLRESPRDRSGSVVQSAIKVLMELHRLAEAKDVEAIAGPGSTHDVASERAPSRNASSLAVLFSDRTAFPSVGHIAEVTRLPIRPKESRDRYVARMVRHLDSLSTRDRVDFFKGISTRLNKAPESFISKWSKVIEDL